MIKIYIFRVKVFYFCFNLFFIFYSYFSEGFDSHVSFFCFFSISGIAPLITCFALQFKNMFRKFITSLNYSNYSVFQILQQIYLLFNFLSVIRNLITVNALIVSCCQTIVRVLSLIMLKEWNKNGKRILNIKFFSL